jgi:hypothetical protein
MQSVKALHQADQDTGRLSVSEGVAKYGKSGVTGPILDRRANKVCAALDGHVECVDGMWKIVGAPRVLKAIDEERPLSALDRTCMKPVKTFADKDLAAFAVAMAKLIENEAMTSRRVAKRLSAAAGRRISSQQLDGHWSNYCPALRRAFQRTAVIDPTSNRGFVWVYDAEDETELTKALKSRAKVRKPDLTEPVTLGVAAKAAGLARRSQRLYLNELIAKGKLPATKEPDPNRRGHYRYKVLVADLLNMPKQQRNSWKPATAKLYQGKRRVPMKLACEIIGCTRKQLDHMSDNPGGTPRGIYLHKYLFDGKHWSAAPKAFGVRKGRKRTRPYWIEDECGAVAAAIAAGTPSPKKGKKGAAAFELPPVKLIKGERYVPTQSALSLTKCKRRNELIRLNERTGKPRREQVKVSSWRRDYWHEGDCREVGIRSSPADGDEQKKQDENKSRVTLLPNENAAIVDGVRKELTPLRRKIVAALIDAGTRRMILSELRRRTSHDVQKLLKLMSKDKDWARVLHFPGSVKGAGYGIF